MELEDQIDLGLELSQLHLGPVVALLGGAGEPIEGFFPGELATEPPRVHAAQVGLAGAGGERGHA